MHHGVKDQQWGVRNGPPYPLNAQGKRNFRYHQAVRKARTAKQVVDECANFTVGSQHFWNDKIENGKKFLSGLTNSHDWDWQESTYNDVLQQYKPAADRHTYYEEHDMVRPVLDENGFVDISAINPGFALGADGTTQNCAKCSACIELKYRGYNNFFAGRQSFPSACDAEEVWFKGAEQVNYDSPASAEMYLKAYGPGASGTLGMQRDNGTGHALHWRVGNDGSLRIEDGQNGRIYSSMEEVNDACCFNGGRVTTYRLDNCEPDWDAMGRDSVVRNLFAGNVNPNSVDAYYNDQNNMYTKPINKITGKIVNNW